MFPVNCARGADVTCLFLQSIFVETIVVFKNLRLIWTQSLKIMDEVHLITQSEHIRKKCTKCAWHHMGDVS